METSCIYVDIDEVADLHHVKMVKAKKTHKCCECGEVIKKGLMYEKVKMLFDGYWAEYKTCARCLLVRADYFENWYYGFMVELFQEEYGVDYREGIPEGLPPCRKTTPQSR